MRRNKLTTFAVLSLLLCSALALTSCSGNDEPVKKPANEAVKAVPVVLPSTSFGATKTDLKSLLSQAEGTIVTELDNEHLKVITKVGDVTAEYTYTFDPDSVTYQYAEGVLPKENMVDDVVKYLADHKFVEEKSANTDKRIFRAEGTPAQLLVLDVSTRKVFFGRSDETTYSWTRIKPVTDASGLIMPFFGHYASPSLVRNYEELQGHKLNVAATSEKEGYYTFDTGDAKFPQVRYTFDSKTLSKLIGAKVSIGGSLALGEEQVEKFFEAQGFYYTTMRAQADDARLFYDETRKATAFVLIEPEKGSDAKPYIDYGYADMTGQVPPRTIDFPWPNTKFMQMTIDEAQEAYKALDYVTEVTPVDEMFVNVTTKSPDIKEMLLVYFDGIYAGVLLIPRDEMVARSPYIKKLLAQKGYVFNSKKYLTSYENTKEGIEVQIDLTGEFLFGFPCIAFMPKDAAGAKRMQVMRKAARQKGLLRIAR